MNLVSFLALLLSASLTKLIRSSILPGNPGNPTGPALHCETVFLLGSFSIVICTASLCKVLYTSSLVFLYGTTFLPFGLSFCIVEPSYSVPSLLGTVLIIFLVSCMVLPSSSLYCPLCGYDSSFSHYSKSTATGCTMELIAQ